MSTQLESRHFFRTRDRVQRGDGVFGEVMDGQALYASVRWDDGGLLEIEQFDSTVSVVQRAESS